jgi:hypothetical protein
MILSYVKIALFLKTVLEIIYYSWKYKMKINTEVIYN